jgi:transposase
VSLAVTPAERDERRRRVEHLTIAGSHVNAIAAALHVNRKTVLRDQYAIRAEWARARVDAYDRHASEELVRLAKLQEAVWGAALQVGTTYDVGEDGRRVPRSLEDRKFSLACAREARMISDQRSKLLGLYAPLRLDVRDDRMQSREDFDREVMEHLARLDAADAGVVEAEARAILEGARRNGDD